MNVARQSAYYVNRSLTALEDNVVVVPNFDLPRVALPTLRGNR